MLALTLALLSQLATPVASPWHAPFAAPRALRTVAIDERLAADARIAVGDTVVLSPKPSGTGDTAIVSAIVKRSADPAEVARAEYRIRMHLDELESLIGYGDRVDRFAVRTRAGVGVAAPLSAINNAAFGFHAWPSKDIAVETSETFRVVSRFHRAIGIITIVASAIFLLCIMLLKVDERRRDIAALRLIGISRRSIVWSVVLEAAMLALVGSALGVVIGEVVALVVNVHYRGVYRTPLAFAIVTPDVLVTAVTLSLVLGILAGLAASLRLVRTPPLVLLGR